MFLGLYILLVFIIYKRKKEREKDSTHVLYFYNIKRLYERKTELEFLKGTPNSSKVTEFT